MFYYQHQNINGSVISVTSTATGIFDLINTAASTTLVDAGFNYKANGVDILPEDGDLRISFDTNVPTATKGLLLSQGVQYKFRNIPLDKMKLIRVSGNVSCSVAIGACDAGETSSAVATSVTLEAGSVTIGNVSGAEAHDAAASANPVLSAVTGYDIASLPSNTAGGDVTRQIGSLAGETYVYKSRNDAGEDLVNNVQKVEHRFSFTNIATATTTAVNSGSGVLHSITVNTTAAGSITVYDNTAGSGTVIGTLKASIVEGTYTYDCAFGTGLTIVTAGASDITVSYRDDS